MQESFRELINRVLMLVPATKSPMPLAIEVRRRLNERYRAVVEHRNWSWLRKEGVFSTVAEYNTGTADVVNGSVSVAGVGTSWDSSMVGYIFRVGSEANYYSIASVGGATALTLDVAYEGSTGTGVGYHVNKNRFSLAADMDHLLEVRTPKAVRPLREADMEWLNSTYPSRPLYGDPLWYAYVRTVGGTEEIELFPVPDRAIAVRYVYISQFVALDADTDVIPEEVRADSLVFGTIADMMDDPVVKRQYEGQFQSHLAEMVSADLREARPSRVGLAPQYVGHRRRRGAVDSDDWWPWTENPY